MWKTEEVPQVYLMALCAWREARGCQNDAIRGVLHVIQNRAEHPKWWGASIIQVVLKPYQFSSFLAGDPNATKFPQEIDPVFANILQLTDKVLNHQDEDLSGGAVFYHDANVFPEWAAKAVQTAKIGPFTFYKES